MEAHEFTAAKLSDAVPGKSYCFGLSREATVAALRDLADRIEKKEVALQKCRVVTQADTEDFTFTYLRMAFAEAKEKLPNGRIKLAEDKHLYGSEAAPDAVAKAG